MEREYNIGYNCSGSNEEKLHLHIIIKTNSVSACWRLPPHVFGGLEGIARNDNFLKKSKFPTLQGELFQYLLNISYPCIIFLFDLQNSFLDLIFCQNT